MKSVDPPPLSPGDRAGHLLRANAALADEAAWLGHLNRYLALDGLEPLRLAEGTAPRLLRVNARTPRSIESGPLVSVVMPAWNAAETLEWAANSVLNQTWRPVELLIIDDASDDVTPGIAADLARRDGRVRVLRLPVNAGPYVAKNLALGVARGEFIMGQDADEWAHPERIERRMATMQANPRLRGVHDRMLRVRKDGRVAQFGQRGGGDDSRMLRVSFSGACFERRFFVERLGHFDTVLFGADAELLDRAERLLGGDYAGQWLPGVLSMDDPRTLSRHPEHGISRKTGLSPVRLAYRDAYRAWHATPGPESTPLPFPHEPRLFPAPDVMLVPAATAGAASDGFPVS